MDQKCVLENDCTNEVVDAITSNTDNVVETTPPLKHHPNICQPIENLSHVWTYTQNPPNYVNRIIELIPRSNLVIKNSVADCHVESSRFTPKVRFDQHSVPRTLICHDMKGGYLEDKYVGPINVGNGYTFYRWSHIDMFVYFSHYLITIPPFSWINVAHRNGVKILGTFITESSHGKLICDEIFANLKTMNKFVDCLVDICVLFKMDGWLLNIENHLDDPMMVKEFVRNLTEACHRRRPGSEIIWYDSVTRDGTLKWQNELNNLNRCYFDACDGIFLNYTWTEANLINTFNAAEHRCLDVYVGVDVFGRNSYGGGNFNSYLAAEKIRQYNLSMAIFAQGWTYETLLPQPTDTILERFFNRDNAFWRSLWPYLYTHLINKPFQTFFYTGVDKESYKLHDQETQLAKSLHSIGGEPEDFTVPTLLGSCNCLKLLMHDKYTSCLITKERFDENKTYIHHLFSCDIQVNKLLIAYTVTKNMDKVNHIDYLSLVLLIKHVNGAYQKIICNSYERENVESDFSLLEINPSKNQNIINMITYQNKFPSDWSLRCYLINIANCAIVEIGAKIDKGNSVCLCGIGISEATMF